MNGTTSTDTASGVQRKRPVHSYAFSAAELQEMGYVFWRQLEDGEWAGVMPMTFGKGRLCAGLNRFGYEDGWCYESLAQAVSALSTWDPTLATEPEGWFRHPFTGRRRPGGDASLEYVSK